MWGKEDFDEDSWGDFFCGPGCVMLEAFRLLQGRSLVVNTATSTSAYCGTCVVRSNPETEAPARPPQES